MRVEIDGTKVLVDGVEYGPCKPKVEDRPTRIQRTGLKQLSQSDIARLLGSPQGNP